MITTINPNSAAFPYVTATTQNPNGLLSYVTIGGSLYDQLYLGTLSFAVSSVSAGQTATINAAGVPECDGGPTTYWMSTASLWFPATRWPWARSARRTR